MLEKRDGEGVGQCSERKDSNAPKRMKTRLFIAYMRTGRESTQDQDVRVGGKSRSHGPGDDFLILFQIRDGGEGKTPVSDLYKMEGTLSRGTPFFGVVSTNWSPEMSACKNHT
jgi:hypothetical protein